MKHFSIEHKLDVILQHASSNSNKIHQEIISKICKVFIFYRTVLIDMLNFKNLIWWLIRTRTISYRMSTVDLTASNRVI